MIHSRRNARSTREWGVATTNATTVIRCRTVAAAHELMKFSFPHFLCVRMFPRYESVMFVTQSSMVFSLCTTKASGGTYDRLLVFSISPTSRVNTRRIRRCFGIYLRGSPKIPCSRFYFLVITSKLGPRGSVVVGAEVIHSGWNARSTREWGVATTNAVAVTRCTTVAAAHEVMNFLLPPFLCEDVHTLRVYDVRHAKFDGVLSLHSQGEWGHV